MSRNLNAEKRRRHRFLLSVAIISCVLVAGVGWIICCGNPQWNKYIYLVQAHLYGETPEVPDNYNGIWREWYEDGTLHRRVKYTDGKQQSYKEWYQSGKLSWESVYNGCNSHAVFYDKDGNKVSEAYARVQDTKVKKIFKQYSNSVLTSTKTRVLDKNGNLLSESIVTNQIDTVEHSRIKAE